MILCHWKLSESSLKKRLKSINEVSGLCKILAFPQNTIFKHYTPFIVREYWLYSPCCKYILVAYFVHNSLYLFIQNRCALNKTVELTMCLTFHLPSQHHLFQSQILSAYFPVFHRRNLDSYPIILCVCVCNFGWVDRRKNSLEASNSVMYLVAHISNPTQVFLLKHLY